MADADYLRDNSPYKQPVFSLLNSAPRADEWRVEIADDGVVTAFYTLREDVGVADVSGSFQVPELLAPFLADFVGILDNAVAEWRRQRIELVKASSLGVIFPALRNLVTEIAAAGNVCPETPRSLAEIAIRSGHKYGISPWEADHMERKVQSRYIYKAYTLRSYREWLLCGRYLVSPLTLRKVCALRLQAMEDPTQRGAVFYALYRSHADHHVP